MECIHCGAIIPSDSRYCSNCGAGTSSDIFTEKPVQANDTPFLLGYIAWLVLNGVIYVFLQKFVLSISGNMSAITVLTRINLAIAIIDMLLLLLVTILSKTSSVKIAFGIFLVVKILLRVIPFVM